MGACSCCVVASVPPPGWPCACIISAYPSNRSKLVSAKRQTASSSPVMWPQKAWKRLALEREERTSKLSKVTLTAHPRALAPHTSDDRSVCSAQLRVSSQPEECWDSIYIRRCVRPTSGRASLGPTGATVVFRHSSLSRVASGSHHLHLRVQPFEADVCKPANSCQFLGDVAGDGVDVVGAEAR